MFILLFFLGIILLIFSVELESHPFWNLVSGFMSSAVWLILSLSQLQIEIPYQMFNVTSGNIEVGMQTFSSNVSPYLVYFFFGLFVVLQIYTWVKVFDLRTG